MNRQYVGARYVPVFADPIEWNNQKVYEPLTIVTYMGSSYTSKKSVPAGTMPTNNEYWALTGNYNAQVELYRQMVEQYTGEVDKLKNLEPNIKDFGAVGDGIADDTDAFNKWFEFITTNGLTGFIPNGTYKLTKGFISLGDKPHYGIRGESKNGVTLNMVNGTSCLACYGVKGCEVRNLTINMNQNANTTTGYALYLRDACDVVYEDIVIKNVGYAALLAYPSTSGVNNTLNNISINRVEVYGFGGKNVDGVHPTGFLLSSAKNCHITNCYVEGINYYSYEFKNFSTQCVVSNCIAYNCNHGFYLGGDADFPDGRKHYTEFITFADCVAIDCVTPYFFGQCKNVTVDSCQNVYKNGLTEESIAVNTRYAENIYITGVYWFSYNALDIRNVTNFNFTGAAYRTDGSAGRFISTVAPLSDVYINFTGHNEVYPRLSEAIEGVTLVYSDNNIGAPTLISNFVSNSGDYIRQRYRTGGGGVIDVDYQADAAKVVFTFRDNKNAVIGTHTITPDSAEA